MGPDFRGWTRGRGGLGLRAARPNGGRRADHAACLEHPARSRTHRSDSMSPVHRVVAVALVATHLACAARRDGERVADEITRAPGMPPGSSAAPRIRPGAAGDRGRRRAHVDEAAAIALWNSPALRADFARLASAQADLEAARRPANPFLRLLAPSGPMQFYVWFAWPLEAFATMPKRIRLAKANLDAVAGQVVQTGRRSGSRRAAGPRRVGAGPRPPGGPAAARGRARRSGEDRRGAGGRGGRSRQRRRRGPGRRPGRGRRGRARRGRREDRRRAAVRPDGLATGARSCARPPRIDRLRRRSPAPTSRPWRSSPVPICGRPSTRSRPPGRASGWRSWPCCG